jgi:hypothetical protein
MRVDAISNVDTMLASAWLCPTGTAVTVVLVNSGNAEVDTKLTVPAGIGGTTTVTRTVFGGTERGVSLGSLSDAGILSPPARAIVTVAFAPPQASSGTAGRGRGRRLEPRAVRGTPVVCRGRVEPRAGKWKALFRNRTPRATEVRA